MKEEMPKGIVVTDLDQAMGLFLTKGEVVGKQSRLIETTPQIPLEWTILRSTINNFYSYQADMDRYFEPLKDCELAFMNGFQDSAPILLSNGYMFPQHVSEGEVIYGDDDADEVYQRVERGNERLDDKITIGGVTHVHPTGVLGPSLKDLAEFEKRTLFNMGFQNFYGWVDVTDEFSRARFKGGIKAVLESNDAVVVSAFGKPRIYTKVRYGYSLFVILPRDSDQYWAGIGEAKEYSYNIKPKSYRLLRPEDGVRLRVIEDDGALVDGEVRRSEIERYVRRLGFAHRTRMFMPDAVVQMPFFRTHPEAVQSIEKQMPTTAEELFALFGDFLRFDKTSPQARAIGTVHALLSEVYRSGGYDDQLARAKKILCNISPTYKRAEDMKNGGF